MNRRARLLGCCLALALCPLLGACSQKPRDDCGASERVIDPVLLAFLSRARSAHHLADQREADGDVSAALRSLEELTHGALPPGSPPEASEVLADTHARIADLLSRTGEFEQAASEIEAGLKATPTPSYFRGHLFEVRGLLEERREKSLNGAGRTADAQLAHERSLTAYEEAMKIQAEVISQAAPAASAPRP
jgi:hypothetical protein